MERIDHIALKPGETTELKPQGLHIMLIGLNRPLKSGETIPVKLVFEKAGAIEINVPVESVSHGLAQMQHKECCHKD